MSDDNSALITREQALSMLPDGDYIHTFRGQRIPIGADWPREKILSAISKYQFELTGPMATSTGYGMAFRDEHGVVFVATRSGADGLPKDARRD